jgi:hypothetical protein
VDGGFGEAVTDGQVHRLTESPERRLVGAGEVELRLACRQPVGGQFSFHDREQTRLAGRLPFQLQARGRRRRHRARLIGDSGDRDVDLGADVDAADVHVQFGGHVTGTGSSGLRGAMEYGYGIAAQGFGHLFVWMVHIIVATDVSALAHGTLSGLR